MDELGHYLSQIITDDAMSLYEMFLHDEMTESSLLIQNFNFDKKERLNRNVGGVLVYIYTKSHTLYSMCL